MRRFLSLSVVLAAVAALFVLPGTGQAVDGFSCRASLVRVTGEGALAGVIDSEEVIANFSEEPCFADVGGRTTVNLPGGLGRVVAAESSTSTRSFNNAQAQANTADVVLTVPGAPTVTADALQSSASAQCDPANPAAGPALSGDSTIVGLAIGGTAVEPISGHQHLPLGPAGTLHVNHQETQPTPTTPTNGRLVQRALFLDTPLADVVVAEAIVDYRGKTCAARGV